jgi:Raf kinase inhibitor-like YbhB/YbcL family protein
MFTLTSPAFIEGAAVPGPHTCDGKDLSPALSWTGAPPGTKSFALICDDPDAPVGTWVHWVIYAIPPATTGLAEGVAKTETLPSGARQGLNDFRRAGYGGPCPPRGSPHRYFFRLYALDIVPDLEPNATRAQLDKAMQGHIIGQARLMGKYQRR